MTGRNVKRSRLGLERLEQRVLLANTWTVLAYVNGDNNLESAGVEDINEMESIDLPSEVQIVALFDRVAYWDPWYDDTSNGNWTDTRIGIIQHDNNLSTFATQFVPFDDTDGNSEEDMGNVQTLTNFINRGMQMAPADNYLVILWDHGNALQGFSFDDTSGHNLSAHDLQTAVSMAQDHVDIVGFDGCLMGLVEMGYELKDDTDVMVAAETTIPWDGWGYKYFLQDLADNPQMTTNELATSIVDGYGQLYGNSQTLSAIDLHQMDDLATALDNWAASAMSPDTSASDWAAINSSIRRVPEYYGGDNYRDLGRFMSNLTTQSINENLMNATWDVLNVYEGMIIANHSGTFERATGMMIMLPRDGVAVPSWYTASSYDWVAQTYWDDFLLRQPIVISDTTPPRVIDFVGSERGVIVTFSEPINTGLINENDLSVEDSTGDDMTGEIRWQSGGTVMQWLADGVLPPDVYDITLLGLDTTNFVDFDNNILDGDNDGVAGGNYVHDWPVGDFGALTPVNSLTTSGITVRIWDTTVLNPEESHLQLATPETFNSRVSDVLVVDKDPNDNMIDGIYLYTSGLRGLGLSIEYETDGTLGVVGEIKDQRKDLELSSIAFIASEVPIEQVQIDGPIGGYDINGRALSASFVLPEDVDGDGDLTDPVGFYGPMSDEMELTVNRPVRGDVVLGSASKLSIFWLSNAADLVTTGDALDLSVLGTDGFSDVLIGGYVEKASFGPMAEGTIQAAGFGPVSVGGSMREVDLEATDGTIQQFSISGVFEGSIVTDDTLGVVDQLAFNDDVNAVIHVAAVGKFGVNRGSLDGTVQVMDAMGSLQIVNGDLLAQVAADSIQTLQVTDGNIEGGVTTLDGGVDNLTVKNGSVNADMNIGGHLKKLTILNGNLTAGVTANSAGRIMVTNGSMVTPNGESLLNITTGNVDKIQVRNGDVEGAMTIDGILKNMSVVGGHVNGELNLFRVQKLSIKSSGSGGGSLFGTLNVETVLERLDLRGGNLSADVTAGQIDRINVKSSHGVGGSIIDGNIDVLDGILDRVSVQRDLATTNITADLINRINVKGSFLGRSQPVYYVSAKTGIFQASGANLPKQNISTSPVDVDGGRVVLRVTG